MYLFVHKFSLSQVLSGFCLECVFPLPMDLRDTNPSSFGTVCIPIFFGLRFSGLSLTLIPEQTGGLVQGGGLDWREDTAAGSGWVKQFRLWGPGLACGDRT